jgi:predicted CXXCH cytochrome family protein
MKARLGLTVILASLLAPCLCYAGAHPTKVDDHTDCLACHADHKKAAYIHAPVKQGCLSCHTIENHNGETDVVLKSESAVICRECHAPEIPTRTHFPYGSGMCTRCHSPHGADNPRLLRAKVNGLCLECHLRNSKVPQSRYMPTIDLSLNNSMGHPYERHPVSGALDPLTGTEMSCLSCHLAHGGTKLHYLKMGSEIPEDALNQNTETNDMCHKCHMRLWGLDTSPRNKKNKKDKKNANSQPAGNSLY